MRYANYSFSNIQDDNPSRSVSAHLALLNTGLNLPDIDVVIKYT